MCLCPTITTPDNPELKIQSENFYSALYALQHVVYYGMFQLCQYQNLFSWHSIGCSSPIFTSWVETGTQAFLWIYCLYWRLTKFHVHLLSLCRKSTHKGTQVAYLSTAVFAFMGALLTFEAFADKLRHEGWHTLSCWQTFSQHSQPEILKTESHPCNPRIKRNTHGELLLNERPCSLLVHI